MNKVTLSEITFEELIDKLGRWIKENPQKKEHSEKPVYSELITRKETAKLLKVSLPTLNYWDKSDILKPHRIGRRVLYKLSDIDFAIVSKSRIIGR